MSFNNAAARQVTRLGDLCNVLQGKHLLLHNEEYECFVGIASISFHAKPFGLNLLEEISELARKLGALLECPKE